MCVRCPAVNGSDQCVEINERAPVRLRDWQLERPETLAHGRTYSQVENPTKRQSDGRSYIGRWICQLARQKS